MVLSKKELGMKIKEARKIKGDKLGHKYTGQDLSTDLNLSRSYIGDIESGRKYPNYALLNQIASVLDVPISFFDDNDSPMEKIKKLASENKIQTLAAHFEGTDFTDEDVEDIENFINFVVQKRSKNK